MIRTYSLCILLIFSCVLHAQEIGHLVTVDGQRSGMYARTKPEPERVKGGVYVDSDMMLSGTQLYFHDESRSVVIMDQKDVAELYFGDDVYRLMSIKSVGLERLHRIIIESDKYIISSYFYKMHFYMYLWDTVNDKCLLSKEAYGWQSKKDENIYEKYIKPNFRECGNFNELVRKNIAKGYKQNVSSPKYRPIDNLFMDIPYENCE